jgi:hypothetical protein
MAEFLADGPFKLIIAELADRNVMLTQINTVDGERHSIMLNAEA